MQDHVCEAELRLRELEHRTLNSFQMVSSIIRARIEHTDDPAAREQLDWSVDLVDCAARLQRSLADADGRAFETFVRDLCDQWQKLGRERGILVRIVALDRLDVPEDRALHLALVLHELIANAMKHAFAGLPFGAVSVGVSRRDGRTELFVRDDGNGYPRPRDGAGRSHSSGLSMVRALCRDLDAAFEIGPYPELGGTIARVRFVERSGP